MIHDLAQRGIAIRNLTDPIRMDSSNPEGPMGQLAVVMLTLFGQLERTYDIECAAHARNPLPKNLQSGGHSEFIISVQT